MKRSCLSLALSVAASVWAFGAHAEAPGCPGVFYQGTPPVVTGAMGQGTLLCSTAFASYASPVTHGPIWSAEFLTEEALEVAVRTPRKGIFFADTRLDEATRTNLGDLKRSGYQRGHLTPSGDEPGLAAQEESFALSNVVPQTPALNMGVWEGVEASTRGLANADGELYVVTGALFADHDVPVIGPDRVMVPSGVFKAIYDPVTETAGAWVCSNTDDPHCSVVSLTVLRDTGGIDVFPGLAEKIKLTAMAMPAIEASPYAAEARAQQSERPGFTWNDRRVKAALTLLRKAMGRS
ncbi:DNA/RNA non-specific endonuclease [Gluconobacter sp. OJB]|uniref:DNA/RNA non-specific endonuclease n=1 Tax=Gluconobacter sp. OJB TaxID=3145196 RepID=UPI0031F74886